MQKTLTEAGIRTAQAGTHWDASLKGFGLRVGKTRKTFIVLIASGRRQSIGHYPTVTLSEARAEAKRILAEKTLGKVRPTHTAFEDAKTQFLIECEKRNKPRTVKDYTRILNRHYDFKRRGIGDIDPKDLLRNLAKLPPSEKHHAFVTGRIFFSWCVREHLIDRSPMERMSIPANGKSRERVLTDQELTAVWKATEGPYSPFNAIVRLLILTGQRRSEIAHLEWSWIDEEKNTILLPSWLTKNKLEHLFPFGTLAQAVFDQIPRIDKSPYLFPAARIRNEATTVFNGWGKPKAKLDEASGVANWTLHDLRRTVSSGMAALKVAQTHVEKLLNHVSGGTQSPIARVYNRYQFLPEMQDAIERWEAKLKQLIAT